MRTQSRDKSRPTKTETLNTYGPWAPPARGRRVGDLDRLFGRLIVAARPLFSVDRMGGFTLVFAMVEFLVVAAADNMLDYLSFNWYLWFIAGAGVAWTTLRRVDTPSPTSARPA